VLEGGAALEKAAANVSVVRGVLSPERAAAMSARGRDEIDAAGGQPYSAMAMSLVFHTASPFVPTLRADVRQFEVRCLLIAAALDWFLRRQLASLFPPAHWLTRAVYVAILEAM
jgi:coproporphyrinogen III oxidase